MGSFSQNLVAADVSRRQSPGMARTHVRGYGLLKEALGNAAGGFHSLLPGLPELGVATLTRWPSVSSCWGLAGFTTSSPSAKP